MEPEHGPSRQSHKKAASASRLGGFFVWARCRTRRERARASAGAGARQVKQNQILGVNKSLKRGSDSSLRRRGRPAPVRSVAESHSGNGANRCRWIRVARPRVARRPCVKSFRLDRRPPQAAGLFLICVSGGRQLCLADPLRGEAAVGRGRLCPADRQAGRRRRNRGHHGRHRSWSSVSSGRSMSPSDGLRCRAGLCRRRRGATPTARQSAWRYHAR